MEDSQRTLRRFSPLSFYQCPTHHIPIADYRNQLNTVLQRRRLKVVWTDTSTGPQDRPTWTSTAWINGYEYGIGQGSTKSESREAAAKATLDMAI
ncbi:hypothetical protein FISHEDRAFT_75772 [Fistulina hepatica ATCC 64428]|uniref:DRBM domain-containing protein n=1 Tax=Fistulina hepatica ATCC 64428 TaxID=1128425 RepID=A0A0D7A6A9_9AGAR|nr:hypothetical protein FISHEDRAFT_75772 [Fistulina hepatica ATCC 64428]